MQSGILGQMEQYCSQLPFSTDPIGSEDVLYDVNLLAPVRKKKIDPDFLGTVHWD